MLVFTDKVSLEVAIDLVSDIRICIAREELDKAFHYLHVLEYFLLDNSIDKEGDLCEKKDE